MLHLIVKWFISRSIDEDRPLPDWLERWIDRNDDLKQFQKRSRQLGNRLKNDAADWIERPVSPAAADSTHHQQVVMPQRASPRLKRTIIRSLAAGALGAICLLAIFQWRSPRDQAGQPVSGNDREIPRVTAVVTMSEADRERLVSRLTGSRAILGQWQARAKDLPGPALDWKLPRVSVIVEPAEVAGSATGQALATLDRGMESEQQRLTSEVKTAYSFFAHRLPSSLARLVGW
jgi:hypothetical protein